jgi:hypothetical protein
MALCKATKRNGEACTLPANGSQGLCWAHDPANAERRPQGASRGGKAKANKELSDIKSLCKDLTDRVLLGEVEPGPAAVANQFTNTRLRAIEQERKNRETEELEKRLALLENRMGTTDGRRGQWG